MISSSNQEGTHSTQSKKLVGAAVAIVMAVLVTIFVTRPAATTSSFTPLSGLVSLKTMAAESLPYDVAIASPDPTLIEFYADWCTTCQGMASTIAELHQQYGNNINFVMLNIDDPQWTAQIETYGASGVPQFTLLDKDHGEVKTWIGKVPKPILANVFDQLLG